MMFLSTQTPICPRCGQETWQMGPGREGIVTYYHFTEEHKNSTVCIIGETESKSIMFSAFNEYWENEDDEYWNKYLDKQ